MVRFSLPHYALHSSDTSFANLPTTFHPGICEKVAIGKGATSVVRLAHKWDRSEEKLYAVKVRCGSVCASLAVPRASSFGDCRSSGSGERTSRRRSMSRSSRRSSVSHRRCTTSTWWKRSISSRTRPSTGARSWSSALAETSTRRSSVAECHPARSSAASSRS